MNFYLRYTQGQLIYIMINFVRHLMKNMVLGLTLTATKHFLHGSHLM